MTLSMTGFAAVAAELPGCSLAVELRSVNHRYLDLQLRLPDELRGLETAMRELLTAELRRGKVDCRVSLNHAMPGAAKLAVNAERVVQLRDAATEVLRHAPESTPLTVAEILHWPGVLADVSLAAEDAKTEVMALVARALAELDQTRQREGAKLEAVLRERLARMSELVAEAGPLMPAAIKAYQEKLAAKIAEAAASPSDERVHQEIVLYAARIDVDEELARLGTHITEFKRVLDKGGACGKRLDFLCQELNREANTLGSKSVASEMTRISVELKVLIEQMREQVQNIE